MGLLGQSQQGPGQGAEEGGVGRLVNLGSPLAFVDTPLSVLRPSSRQVLGFCCRPV